MKSRIRPAAGLLAVTITICSYTLPAAAAGPLPETDRELWQAPADRNVKAMDMTDASDTGSWEEVMETVRHDEEGHFEYRKTGEEVVVDKEAWDEYIKHWYYECTVCLFRSYEGPSAVSDHILEEHPTGGEDHYYNSDGIEIYPSCREECEIETIHHEAQTHMEDVYGDVWIVDRKAYDEEVPTGVFRYVVDGEVVRDAVLTIDGTPYYFNSEGTAFTEGCVTDHGEEYYFDGTELAMDKWVTTGEGRYYYDAKGKKVTGWRSLNGRRYYFTDERYRNFREADRGKMMTGWAAIGNRIYYFADSRYPAYTKAKEGIMLSGWKTVGGRRYYFMDSFYSDYTEAKKGILLTGFRRINGKTYYLTDARAAGYRDWKRGILVTGRVTIGGHRYFFTQTGAMASGRMP